MCLLDVDCHMQSAVEECTIVANQADLFCSTFGKLIRFLREIRSGFEVELTNKSRCNVARVMDNFRMFLNSIYSEFKVKIVKWVSIRYNYINLQIQNVLLDYILNSIDLLKKIFNFDASTCRKSSSISIFSSYATKISIFSKTSKSIKHQKQNNFY